MSHLDGETIAAYWLDELDEPAAAAVEEHVFACDECERAWARTAALLEAAQALVPPVLTRARVERLRASLPAIKQGDVSPGGRAVVDFGPGEPMFLLHLKADLAGAERVDFSIEAGGQTLLEMPSVPFDRETGAVVVACQRHYIEQGYPPHVQMRLRAVKDGQLTDVGVYTIDHVLSV